MTQKPSRDWLSKMADLEDKHAPFGPSVGGLYSKLGLLGWVACDERLPPDGDVVMTKIDDAKGCRNEQTLKRQGRLWFVPDGSMYVYYCPTHWAALAAAQEPAAS